MDGLTGKNYCSQYTATSPILGIPVNRIVLMGQRYIFTTLARLGVFHVDAPPLDPPSRGHNFNPIRLMMQMRCLLPRHTQIIKCWCVPLVHGDYETFVPQPALT